jgi:uncharacterized protein
MRIISSATNQIHLGFEVGNALLVKPGNNSGHFGGNFRSNPVTWEKQKIIRGHGSYLFRVSNHHRGHNPTSARPLEHVAQKWKPVSSIHSAEPGAHERPTKNSCGINLDGMKLNTHLLSHSGMIGLLYFLSRDDDMARTFRTFILFSVAIIAAIAAGDILWRSWTAHSAEQATQDSTPTAFTQPPGYVSQKVVYHLNEGGGFFGRGFKKVIQVANNHIEAVGADKLDLRIVIQGDGIDMLTDAKGDIDLASRIDKLKAKGVKILVCGNTLRQRKIEMSHLYNISDNDIVRAGVAEVSSLQQQGFVYIKPL